MNAKLPRLGTAAAATAAVAMDVLLALPAPEADTDGT